MRDSICRATRRFPSSSGLLALLAFALPAAAQDGAAAVAQDGAASAAQDGTAAPADDFVYVRMSTTLGDMLLELDHGKAPLTVDNFLTYVDEGFYTGTTFHRIMSEAIHVVQGGGYTAEYVQKPPRPSIQNEATNGLKNDSGTLAMARSNDPHSASCQFYINTRDNPRLDHSAPTPMGWGYCVFGKVIDGLETLEAIRTAPVHVESKVGGANAPDEPVVIQGCVRVAPSECADAITAARRAEVERSAAKARAAAEAAAAKARVLEPGIALVTSKVGAGMTGVHSPSGLWMLDTVVGAGAQPTPSQTVTVHYTGWFTDGTPFDSSRDDNGQPISFSLGGVIKGWTEGVGGMKVGGKRFLVIPFELGYGEQGWGGVIPPRSTLVFEVELLGIE